MSSETIDVPIDGLEAICMVAREQQLRILGVEVTSDQDSVVTGLLAIYCLKNPRFGQTSVLRSLLERVEIGELEITCNDREPLEVTAIAKEWLGRSPQEMSIYIQTFKSGWCIF